jgi:hypothetical protein
MLQFNRIFIMVTGFVLFSVAMAATQLGRLAFLAPFLGLGGILLAVWATLGRGLWCPACKTFPISR